MNNQNLPSNLFVTNKDIFADVSNEDFVNLIAETYTKSVDFMKNRVQNYLEERVRPNLPDKVIRNIYSKITNDEKFRNRSGVLHLIKRYKNK